MSNLQAIAERIVFGTTIADKLAPPGTHAEDTTQVARRLKTKLAPGRPPGLEMHDGPGAARPPSDAKLDNEKARGELLHFLANHELLATELMALVLLKFPEAPHAFRRGVLVTLQEEQEHTRMYLRRMEECGVEFGSFPLSGYFWRAIEPMNDPIDFVSRLSLTFEQANLDYSLHYASVFRRIGDTKTAAILQQIYRDEIGHVKHGLNWFRKWKNVEQSDWEAYKQRLVFPMSPQRARGPNISFNRDGRLEAGLTEDFIDQVELFRQSRGRTPTVLWFDPGAEAELSSSLSSRDASLIRQLGVDLERLMIALAKQDDVLLVRKMPSCAYRKRILEAGIELPEFIPMEESDSLRSRKLHDVAPWSWTPKTSLRFRPLQPMTHQQMPLERNFSHLFRKSWFADRVTAWLQDDINDHNLIDHNIIDHGAQASTPNFLAPADLYATRVDNTKDIPAILNSFASRGCSAALVKLDLATAGRGQRRLDCQNGLNDNDQRWLQSACDTEVILEPELNRVLDISFLWEIKSMGQEPNFLGWTRQLISRNRRYAGAKLGRFMSGVDQPLHRFVLENGCERLHKLQDWLESRLEKELSSEQFVGRFGVDTFLYLDTKGQINIKLCELNPRTTMGHVALALERRLAPGVVADFRILTAHEWWMSRETIESKTLQLSNDGRWQSGVVLLSEPNDSTKLVPVVLIGDAARKITASVE